MTHHDLRADARELQRAALTAVEPAAAARRHVRREGDTLIIAGHHYDLRSFEHVFVVGGGKAVAPMAAAVADILGNRLTAGTVVTKYGHISSQSPNLQITEAGHPVPDENSVRGAQSVVRLAQQATEHDLVICLISGGASALLTLPAPGLTLADLQPLTGALLRSGATINELNTIRKHLSRIKGGHLARLIAPATLITLILSDVVGDPLDVIASGPTVPDPTTVANAQAVLARYGIKETRFLGKTLVSLQETPKPGDPISARTQHVIVGSNRLAALAAVERARSLGFNTLLLSTYIEGEAREVAKVAAALAKGIRAHGDPLPPPACLVWGGETTVTVRGEGKGGRNQELALAAALALDGWPDVLLMALATDGNDGPTDGAGAIATGETMTRARVLDLDARAALAANDSYPFFAALGDLLRTGPTGTNVNDLLFLLVGKSREGEAVPRPFGGDARTPRQDPPPELFVSSQKVGAM
ncbi:MAG: glycerate kinase [Chloroflexi bacterium]|nr:MAG: glycerate kinase [Chloroflexota bacterium]